MTIISRQADLLAYAQTLAQTNIVFVDTEFMRERTYYARLCLLQLKVPGGEAVAIDPLAPDLDLGPVLQALARSDLLKVFHAGRQDLEIFYNLTGQILNPIYDTQIAAGFCGHPDQIGFEAIVAATTNKRVDKTAQFTDWSRRPLTDKQLKYALDDVILLEKVYAKIAGALEARGRTAWVTQALEALCAPDLYRIAPEEMWQRIRVKREDPRTLAVLQELARWREVLAEARNVPRGRIAKDETLAELALQKPKTRDDLLHLRMLDESAKNKYAADILDAVARGMARPESECPQRVRQAPLTNAQVPALEMLKLLQKINAAEADLQPRLLASPDALEDFVRTGKFEAQDFQRDLFWSDAQALMDGRLMIGFSGGRIRKVVTSA